jgi:hypothetical protein
MYRCDHEQPFLVIESIVKRRRLLAHDHGNYFSTNALIADQQFAMLTS